MSPCLIRNFILSIILGLVLAQLISTEIFSKNHPGVELLVEVITGFAFFWLMKGTWLAKMTGALCALPASAIILVLNTSLTQPLSQAMFFAPEAFGILLATASWFLLQKIKPT
ncbi:MAG: hypothetical protein R3240_03235 [Gammaproteobacteria bacterium]|nr:hypothetical protein [Gammaproteobacteria bacterium]